MKSFVLGLAVFAAAAASITPADVLTTTAGPDGWELANGDARDVDFAAFAELSPYSVAHVVEGSRAAEAMRAGSDVWSKDDTDIVLREVVAWGDADTAADYVDGVADYADESGLRPTGAPFGGALAFEGYDDADGVSTELVVWRRDTVGIAVTRLHQGDAIDDDVTGVVATALDANVAGRLGSSESTPGTTSTADGSGSSGGGIPISTVLLWLAIIIGAVILFKKLKGRLAAARTPGAEKRTDDIIEKARRKAREAAAEPRTDDAAPARSTDDIIESARRKARDEVDQIDDASRGNLDDWQPPDDY